MGNVIYLDSAATTLPDPQVLADYMQIVNMYPYNPSSIYTGGMKAKGILDNARNKISNCLQCHDDEIIFTSGGTEGNNMIINGFFNMLPKGETGVLITSQIEHPSVLRVAEKLYCNYSKYHIKVYFLPVDEYGLVSLDDLKNTISAELNEGVSPENILVSIQFVNNEIGTGQDVIGIYNLCKDYGVFYHTDAVQEFPHNCVESNYADAITVSGHKFKALRGTGFVYVSKKLQKHLSPILLGGSQEMNMRAGTENIAGFVSMADRIERMYGSSNHDDDKYYKPLYKYDSMFCLLLIELNNNHINYHINGLTNIPICSITFPGVDATALISCLNEKSIYVSAGSACHSYEQQPSHVLKAIGLSDSYAKSTIRICLNSDITDDDWNYVIKQFIFYINLLKGD